jgi:hypothetical protein
MRFSLPDFITVLGDFFTVSINPVEKHMTYLVYTLGESPSLLEHSTLLRVLVLSQPNNIVQCARDVHPEGPKETRFPRADETQAQGHGMWRSRQA